MSFSENWIWKWIYLVKLNVRTEGSGNSVQQVYMYFRGSGKAAEMKREAARGAMRAAIWLFYPEPLFEGKTRNAVDQAYSLINVFVCLISSWSFMSLAYCQVCYFEWEKVHRSFSKFIWEACSVCSFFEAYSRLYLPSHFLLWICAIEECKLVTITGMVVNGHTL